LNPKRKKLRNNEYYSFQNTQDNLFKRSQNGDIFRKLMNLITSRDNILLAYRNIKSNIGSKTKGTDGKSIEAVAKLETEELVNLVVSQLENYQPKEVRRVMIPKANGKTRPLGIPTIIDRLIQQCILQILEPICEAKFFKHSYGFRPLRSTRHALARSYFLAQKANLHYVVDVDIKGFFDNINHGKLLKQIWALGIRDKKLLKIISIMLKTKIQNEGIPTKGTPQGGKLSPLLANITLNEYDQWIKSQWEEFPTKHEFKRFKGCDDNRLKSMRNLSNLKEIYVVRYADDFKLFCRTHEQAVKAFEATKKWLAQRLKLEISTEKSKIVNLRKNYSEFLGIKFKVTKKGKEKNSTTKYVIKSHVCNKSMSQIATKVRNKIKEMQRPKGNRTTEAIRRYNSLVLGLHNYFNVATNCTIDFSKIDFLTRTTRKNRLILSKITAKDKLPKYLIDSYGKSKAIYKMQKIPILPISYVQHRKAFQYNGLSPYIASDREIIHTNQKSVDQHDLKRLIENPIKGQSAEYNDNRISKFVGQYGKCYVSKRKLNINEMHCHHIKPKALNGSDKYRNLVILHTDIHILIHAKNNETITKYVEKLALSVNELEIVNALRVKAKILKI